MKKTLLPLALALSACGAECDIESRDGTYLVAYENVGGTCGDIPDQLVTVGGSAGGASCVIESEDVSDDMCEISVQGVCTDQGNGIRTYATITTTEASGGLTGTMTVDIRTIDTDTTVCTGTYDLTYTEQ